MIALIIILALALCGIIVYLFIDHSPAAAIERKKRSNARRAAIKEHVIEPLSEKITDAAGDERVLRTERTYRHAGLKIPYWVTVMISVALSIALFFVCWKLFDNIYLGIVGLLGGWFIPNLVIGAIAEKRREEIEAPIGDYMKMTVQRYQSLKSFRKALISTIPEMKRCQLLYEELLIAANALNTDMPVEEILFDLAERLDNKYLWRYADVYRIASDAGTSTAIEASLNQVVKDYERHLKDARLLKRQLHSVTMENKVMLAIVPAVLFYSLKSDPVNMEFYTTTTMGKLGIAIICALWLVCFYIVIYKLGAPLDKEEGK